MYSYLLPDDDRQRGTLSSTQNSTEFLANTDPRAFKTTIRNNTGEGRTEEVRDRPVLIDG